MTRLRHLRWLAATALVVLAGVAMLWAALLPVVPPADPRPAAATAPRHVLEARPREGPHAANIVPGGRPAVRVPILMYHYIRVNPDPRDQLGFNLSVTPSDFAVQMDWLARNGYHPIDYDDLRAYLLGSAGLPERPIILTFDDGYRDMYTAAYPVLRAHRFKAVSYVVSGFVNSPVSVTSEQVLEMDANGIQIGSHTVSHADLTRLSGAGLWHEVYDSKVWLEALLGHPVLDFCYPSGRFNDAVVRAAQAAGYLTATTTQPGTVHSAADRFLWSRVRVDGGEPLERLVADLGPPEPPVAATVPPPPPTPLHGPARKTVTLPLVASREARTEGVPAEGPLP
jgi:peptidoglycan/xylan/chitin deacetylase (PgdA/CDA1 family)